MTNFLSEAPFQPVTSKETISHWWPLLIFFFLAYVLNLIAPRDLWVQDEARYGEVVREMLASGNWLVPHLNGFPYPDKPPLYFWLVILMGKVVGQGEFAFRLISTLSTMLAGVGVFQLGNTLLGRQGGYWAVLLFGSTLLTLIVGQIVRMDMLLTAVCAFAWHALLCFDKTRSNKNLSTFWLLSALALAIKGPITLLFTLIPGLIWRFRAQGVSGILTLRPLMGITGLLLFVSIWLSAVILNGQQDYLASIWHKQLVGRAVNSWSHREPLYFYIVLLPVLLVPWVGLSMQGLRDMFRETDSALKSISIFTLIPLIGLSLLSGKLFIYLEPLMPALCIAGAFTALKVLRKPKVSAWFSLPPAIFLLALGAATLWVSHKYLGAQSPQGMVIGGVILLLGIIAMISTRLSGKHWLYSTVGSAIVLSWLLFGGMAMLLNPLFSARSLGESIAFHAPSSRPVGVINVTRGILNYYAGRTLTEVELENTLAWQSSHPQAVIVIKTSDFASTFGKAGLLDHCRVNETFNLELKEYHVLADC